MRKMGARLKALALGQFLSVLVTTLGYSSSLLVRQGVNVPTLQSFMNYFVLAVVYGSYLFFRKKPLKAHWYLYPCLALVEVEANYFTIKAYQYTSITSVTLLDCWAIPCVLVLTAVILHTRYFRGHYLGVVLCVLGLMLVLLSDVHAGDRDGGSNVLLGDFLVFIGSTLYAIANVYEEFMVKKNDRAEILAFLGFFGAVITAVQVFILERNEVRAIHWNSSVIIPLLIFSASQLSFSSVFLILIQTDGSAMFNLSLLTSDMYAVAIRWLIFHETVDYLYFGAFATVAVGLVVYAYSGEPPDEFDGNIPYERVGMSLVDPVASDPELAPGTFDPSMELVTSNQEKVHALDVELSVQMYELHETLQKNQQSPGRTTL
ncbi:solute carrier family 35, member F1/2 [Marchantia polymorpha subsp. ruderalis]|uniref:EamA domain-containing protein n=2 Tax=Marchantia polymorpha TaxID=3197 RepID=A0AAF6BAZ9_MARPO|nr:hypothetical protein MARPO_0041s0066 [Marchantia polymorpha]BBN09183.1 hypothetical protein Mp_4g17850 [Marchantia polymorpha subsp. ruderalis]|eukprot:PTQ40171.1 hypothetical protein MARPO_0041s0066 [Marchantia polymorpha]